SVPAGRAVEPDCKTRSNTEGDDAPGEHEQPGLGQDEPEGDGGDDSGDQANKRWQEYARGEVSQAVDIADEEVERLLAVQHSPDRRSARGERFPDPDAHIGQRSEDGVMHPEALDVAENGASDAEEAHADDRDHQVED